MVDDFAQAASTAKTPLPLSRFFPADESPRLGSPSTYHRAAVQPRVSSNGAWRRVRRGGVRHRDEARSGVDVGPPSSTAAGNAKRGAASAPHAESPFGALCAHSVAIAGEHGIDEPPQQAAQRSCSSKPPQVELTSRKEYTSACLTQPPVPTARCPATAHVAQRGLGTFAEQSFITPPAYCAFER
eukprot:scaffold277083_cov28-Tisochrysis_lutea.AAC.6